MQPREEGCVTFRSDNHHPQVPLVMVRLAVYGGVRNARKLAAIKPRLNAEACPVEASRIFSEASVNKLFAPFLLLLLTNMVFTQQSPQRAFEGKRSTNTPVRRASSERMS
jgi:hypothetical protein